MTIVHIVDPVRILDDQEFRVAIETMRETLHYGPPQLRKFVRPTIVELSGDIHKLSTKTEADAALLQAQLQSRINCTFAIRQQSYSDEIRWSDDNTC